ncbi:MAG TPA: AbiEi antitoxin N-terminal domain-containing protein [Vicinamibacterales bacterium]|nr:AbiEi antitoxin N-terminal domain-containing protein [Vicinamibacterales bacterium]
MRSRDLVEEGYSRNRALQLHNAGRLERVGRGLYRVPDSPITEHDAVARVCKQAPQAIVCLLTALEVHGLGTQAPRDIWIAIDRKARKPHFTGVRVRIVRFSGPMMRYGIVERQMQGVTVRLTSPARTIVDCFRYRNKLGLDVALEALRDALRSRSATVAEIIRAADMCRARTIVRPYVEALVS